jgi:hypothetical protein
MPLFPPHCQSVYFVVDEVTEMPFELALRRRKKVNKLNCLGYTK